MNKIEAVVDYFTSEDVLNNGENIADKATKHVDETFFRRRIA